jgi:hypothetical protein
MLPPRAARRAGRAAPLVLVPLLLFAPAGCRHADQEILESELRARERDVRELRDEVGRLECHNEALQHELGTAYQQGAFKIAPEQAAVTFGLRRVTIGRGTGGYDQDRQLGDEALQVVVEPRDDQDHVIKAPGTLSVTALEVSPEGIKTAFSSWTIPPEQLRKAWKSGFFSTGYILVLPFQAPPHSEQVRVVVRLQTGDGRLFEADRDVRVVLRPEALHEKPPAGGPTPPAGAPAAPPPEPVPLPPPRKLDAAPPPGPALPAPPVEQIGVWQVPSLEGAAQLGRPVVGEAGEP